MTGFSSRDGVAGPTAWHWELRSVNGRGLDIRLRLPPGFEALEPRIRAAVSQRLARGSVAVNLSAKRTDGGSEIRLNASALRQVLAALEALKSMVEVAPPRAEALLGIKGVLELVEPEESAQETTARSDAMLADLEHALGELVAVRNAEGRRLEQIVLDQLLVIERLTQQIAGLPARSIEAVRARLKEQVGRLLESNANFDETRLYQEAALLAARADVEEELKRIGSHVAAARELLAVDAPAGRRLDFLAQELNREANTLCSKANDEETTRAGLDLKAVIDQMREQVQNVE
ncbi:MAG TPA: YicC/YloC family endoribonuclease [Hyphomicrobiaceae bacterium]|nr:YicC/YloC family endoribonuclease [Hyphomicrobiaceae bacterium]